MLRFAALTLLFSFYSVCAAPTIPYPAECFDASTAPSGHPKENYPVSVWLFKQPPTFYRPDSSLLELGDDGCTNVDVCKDKPEAAACCVLTDPKDCCPIRTKFKCGEKGQRSLEMCADAVTLYTGAAQEINALWQKVMAGVEAVMDALHSSPRHCLIVFKDEESLKGGDKDNPLAPKERGKCPESPAPTPAPTPKQTEVATATPPTAGTNTIIDLDDDVRKAFKELFRIVKETDEAVKRVKIKLEDADGCLNCLKSDIEIVKGTELTDATEQSLGQESKTAEDKKIETQTSLTPVKARIEQLEKILNGGSAEAGGDQAAEEPQDGGAEKPEDSGSGGQKPEEAGTAKSQRAELSEKIKEMQKINEELAVQEKAAQDALEALEKFKAQKNFKDQETIEVDTMITDSLKSDSYEELQKFWTETFYEKFVEKYRMVDESAPKEDAPSAPKQGDAPTEDQTSSSLMAIRSGRWDISSLNFAEIVTALGSASPKIIAVIDQAQKAGLKASTAVAAAWEARDKKFDVRTDFSPEDLFLVKALQDRKLISYATGYPLTPDDIESEAVLAGFLDAGRYLRAIYGISVEHSDEKGYLDNAIKKSSLVASESALSRLHELAQQNKKMKQTRTKDAELSVIKVSNVEREAKKEQRLQGQDPFRIRNDIAEASFEADDGIAISATAETIDLLAEEYFNV